MKPIILLTGFILIFNYNYAQTKPKFNYLVVKIEDDYDRQDGKEFFRINAEEGNPFAKEVYQLMPYKTDKKTITPGGAFYYKVKDTTASYYNYFQNRTEALLFLASNGWELIAVYNQVVSDYSSKSSGNIDYPYTIVSSYPVYYFKKEIQ